MPRDLNGDYTLPPGNPVVTNTTITISWANDTMNDLGLEVTNSLSRFGFGGMLAPLIVPAGSDTARGYAFTGAAGAGMSLVGTDDLRLGYVGNDVVRISPLGLQQWDSVGLVWENVVADGDDASLGNVSCLTLTATDTGAGALTSFGGVNANGPLTGSSLQTGNDITTALGDLVATTGNCNCVTLNASTSVVTADVQTGSCIATGTVQGAQMTATTGNITASLGDIVAATGNIAASSGGVSGQTLFAASAAVNAIGSNGGMQITGGIDCAFINCTDIGASSLDANGTVQGAQFLVDNGTATVGGAINSSGAEMQIRGGTPAASGSILRLRSDTGSDGDIEITRGADTQMLFAINGAIAAPDVFINDNAPVTPVQRLVGYRPVPTANSVSTNYAFTESQLNGYYQYTGATVGVDLELADALGKPGDFFHVYNMSAVSVDVVCIGGTFAVMQGAGAPANVGGIPLVGGGHIHFVKGVTNQWLATGAGMTGFPPT